jgi:outer membrane protein assembly factor BamB
VTKNVRWKQEIPGLGWSSPVIANGRVYLTTAVPVGSSRDHSLRTLCLDAGSGRPLWNVEVFRQDGSKAPRVHTKNSHASPTPVWDGRRLFVHFGHDGTACLDAHGNIVWKNTSLRYTPVHGNGGSPIIVDDLLVFSIDGSDVQCLVALDRATGKVRWETDRRSDAYKKFSFSTPLLIEHKGRRQIISPASDFVGAYDPRTGKELWRVHYDGYSVVPRPVFAHGLVFLSCGYDDPVLYAIRLDGAGDVTETHVAWKAERNAPLTPSPLVVDDELYVVSDRGIATCFDARSGKVQWQERLGGNYSACPLFADGKIYFQSEEGIGSVIKPGTCFELVAKNKLEERTLASYAVADGALFIRGESHLFRIEQK